MRYFRSFFHTKSLKARVYLTFLAHCHSNALFSSTILDLYLGFIDFHN